MTPARLIVEGVSGAGKSRVLRLLRRRPEFRGALVLTERETFGELMSEPLDRPAFLRRLTACLERLARLPAGRACLVERFHPSYHALVPDWALYAPFDRRLKRLGFKLAVLRVPEAALARRSLDRTDRSPRWRAGMRAYFGGRGQALKALKTSQRRRLAAARRTTLACRICDAREGEWTRLAAEMAEFARGGRPR